MIYSVPDPAANCHCSFLSQLISRIDADPDVMPRLNNFGLNVFEFRAQFCHECPEAFWRLAFLCCSLDPDRRPPFGESRRWLDWLVLDAAMGVAPSEGLLLELEGYGEGENGCWDREEEEYK